MGFLYAPSDALQGEVQRIMYLHVPLVVGAYVAFTVVFAGSVLYLTRRESRWDGVAHASAEVGVLFMALAVAAGSIWGKPTWGTWWTWDARLITSAILVLIFLGYLMLRAAVEDPERRARYAAVVGIIGFLDVPLVHFSVNWWRTLHQPSSLIREGGPSIAPPMLLTLAINVVAFVLLYLYLFVKRLQVERCREEILRLQREAVSRG